MNPPHAYKWIEELKQQCRFGLLAFQSLRTALNESDQERTFLFAHAFLQHASQIAQILGPERDASLPRGEFLRRQLGLSAPPDGCTTATRLAMRRADETFEDWLATLESPSYVEMSVMTQGTLAGFKQDVFQRHLDPETLRLSFRSASVDLHQVARELRQLETACQTWLRQHSPW